MRRQSRICPFGPNRIPNPGGDGVLALSGAPKGERNGNYKHGRYTAEVAATRRWLREATHMLRDLNKRPR